MNIHNVDVCYLYNTTYACINGENNKSDVYLTHPYESLNYKDIFNYIL